MPLNDILDVLRTSKIVNRIVFTKFDGVSDSYAVKIRVELSSGWLLDCWEHKTPKIRRYSFHVFHIKTDFFSTSFISPYLTYLKQCDSD